MVHIETIKKYRDVEKGGLMLVGSSQWVNEDRAKKLVDLKLAKIIEIKREGRELSYKELQEKAKEKGIPSNQKKEALIEALNL